ncbi:AMP-dependent synthetase/ligase [Fimbriimonas ginsengisoli]|uniref:AMP-dependent synthetase and ligase n=1 Tax=Fimbriimonas ginsengisoli Gsoil 348 TaxID=661478 RepID=A0A068NNN8_FIMGI|nr:long-chain fatty acid--CoA ligase [Fimbriimonas ginsengisoli]AIE85041.1 AMP-dependent synthetase and ligase [Fimbriimonas ginsengisoli Gsoil 348]
MKATSLGDMFRSTAARLPDKVAMLVPEKSEFRPVLYGELFDTARHYAAALRSRGIRRGDKVCLISENCAEWAFTDWACQCLGIILVPIYPTLPADQAEYIVRDCDAKLIVAGNAEQMAKVACIQGVESIVLKGEDSLDLLAKTQDIEPDEFNREIDSTKPEDLCTIIYTSGTTGLPKGAMMPHRAFVHVCECAQRTLPLGQTDTFLTFLPMSHVYERVAGQFLPICLGASIGYAKSLASLAGDMLKVRPTVMLCVPRFLESFREKALEGIAKMPPVRQKLFHLAMAQGIARAKGKFAPLAGLLDHLVMGKLREKVGGRMRFFVSGGAALAPRVAEFYMGTGLTVLQGYGLTETAGGTCINHPDRNKYWTVGEPLDVEIRIAEDGEILIRGAGNMLGYYNLPEETAAAIDADGWFHTGDIGEFEGKSLKITDRKKDLIVLGNGKNVAPQPIENKLRNSRFIQEAVVLGDGLEACIALIVPNAETVGPELHLPEGTKLSESPEVRGLIKREIDAVNKTGANFEAVKKFALLDHPFTIEGGEITPTLKVKRKVVKEKYAKEIASLKL